jgi:hypothetical protein
MDDAAVPRNNPGFLTAIVAPACFVGGFLIGRESTLLLWTGWTIGLLVALLGTVRACVTAGGRSGTRSAAFLPALWVNVLIVLLFLVVAWALTRDTSTSHSSAALGMLIARYRRGRPSPGRVLRNAPRPLGAYCEGHGGGRAR